MMKHLRSGTRSLSEPGEGDVTGMGESRHSSRGGVPDRSSGFGRGAGLTCSDLAGREPGKNTPF